VNDTTVLGTLGKALRRCGRVVKRLTPVRWEDREHVITERWDREWVNYFLDEDIGPFLMPHTSLSLAADVRGQSARAVHGLHLTRELPPLAIYMAGDQLLGRRVFEVGCGPGLLCKQLGLIAEKVVGIDYSRFALRIARYVSPPTCSYFHSSQDKELEQIYGTFDSMVCRFFFIHQNYRNSLKLLGLARRLLKPGGVVGADFSLSAPNQRPGILLRAKSRLSKRYPSCAFIYTMKEIEELAATTGFTPRETWESAADHRRFVTLVRQ
jgi:SAM-dependent methyltransferase